MSAREGIVIAVNILKHKITAGWAVIFVDIHPIIGIY